VGIFDLITGILPAVIGGGASIIGNKINADVAQEANEQKNQIDLLNFYRQQARDAQLAQEADQRFQLATAGQTGPIQSTRFTGDEFITELDPTVQTLFDTQLADLIRQTASPGRQFEDEQARRRRIDAGAASDALLRQFQRPSVSPESIQADLALSRREPINRIAREEGQALALQGLRSGQQIDTSKNTRELASRLRESEPSLTEARGVANAEAASNPLLNQFMQLLGASQGQPAPPLINIPQSTAAQSSIFAGIQSPRSPANAPQQQFTPFVDTSTGDSVNALGSLLAELDFKKLFNRGDASGAQDRNRSGVGTSLTF
jgi:hypothetical protein